MIELPTVATRPLTPHAIGATPTGSSAPGGGTAGGGNTAVGSSS